MSARWTLGVMVVVTAVACEPPEGVDQDDLFPAETYAGTSFNEVASVIAQGVYPETPNNRVGTDMMDAPGKDLLHAATQVLFSNDHDYHPYFRRLLHANGICFTGHWDITDTSHLSGFYRNGSHGLVIARASTAFSTVRRSEGNRAFAFAIKLYPTLDGNAVVKTGNLFFFDRLVGARRPTFLGSPLRNNPPLGVAAFEDLGLAQRVMQETLRVDIQPRRPTFPVAQLGEPPDADVVYPYNLWLEVQDAATPDHDDFRDELTQALAQRPIVYTLRASGFRSLHDPRTPNKPGDTGPIALGTVTLETAVVSTGCDNRVRFRHHANP